MTNEELLAKIKAEIERRKKALHCTLFNDEYNDLLSFLDTLESEKPIQKDLEEAADEIAIRAFPEKKSYSTVIDRVVDYNAVDRKNYRDGIIAGAEWHADHAPLPEDTVLFNKGVEEGKRPMMEEAVKWLVDDDYDELTDKGGFILGSVGIGYNGYYIPYSDLLKLPKED